MRPVVALLACLSAGALAPALADPPAATSTTPPATPATAPAPKPADDEDVKHFVAEGYKPEKRGGQQVYCRKETKLGSHFPTTTCATIEQLKLQEQQAKDSLQQVQQSQGH